jgi:type III secretion protein J
MRAKALIAVLALGSLGAVGCTREVANGLEEADANRGVVALARANVDAEKLADPTVEGRFRIVVGRDEATVAISVLASEEIPRPKTAAVTPSGVLPSPEADRAARVAAIATQIERSLGSIDGVHDARVHLDVPNNDPLVAALSNAPEKTPRATASVLIRHRSANPPIVADDVRKLVAGAVSGLAPESIAVVMVQVPQMTLTGDRELAHLGPIAVTRGSLPTLRLVLIGALIALMGLGAALLAMAMRVRRLSRGDEREPAPAR